MNRKPFTVYLGWDGAYVLSLAPLRKMRDKSNGNYFLAPAKGKKCIDIGDDGRLLFAHLRLVKYEVVKLTISVGRFSGALVTRVGRVKHAGKPAWAKKQWFEVWYSNPADNLRAVRVDARRRSKKCARALADDLMAKGITHKPDGAWLVEVNRL